MLLSPLAAWGCRSDAPKGTTSAVQPSETTPSAPARMPLLFLGHGNYGGLSGYYDLLYNFGRFLGVSRVAEGDAQKNKAPTLEQVLSIPSD